MVRFGGDTDALMVLVRDAQLALTRCVIEKAIGAGLWLDGSSTGAGIVGNLLRGSTTWELSAAPPAMATLVPSNAVELSSDGKYNGYQLQGATLTTSLSLPKPPTGLCYIVSSGQHIIVRSASNPILTLQPETILKFFGGSLLEIGGSSSAATDRGRLVANGVMFTSARRDTMGDTNGDGAVAPAAGDWAGIALRVFSSPTSVLDECVIEYASTGLTLAVGVPQILRTAFQRCSSGISCTGASIVTAFHECDIVSNTASGLRAASSASPTLDLCNVAGNVTAGVENQSATPPLLTSNVWWGAPSGPSPGGQGDRIIGNVTVNTPLTIARPRLPGDDNPILVFTVQWIASPVLVDCAGPTDGTGHRWYELGFDDSAYTPVSFPDVFAGPTTDRFFRTRFNWTNGLARLRLSFGADDGLVLYCNGILIGSFGNGCHVAGCVNNPIGSCGASITVPDIDITPLLVNGPNVIAAHVTNGPSGGVFRASLTLTDLTPRVPVLTVLDPGTGDRVALRWLASLVSPTSGFHVWRQLLPNGSSQLIGPALTSDDYRYVDDAVVEGKRYRYWVASGDGAAMRMSDPATITVHKPVALVHGWCGSVGTWSAMQPRLANKGYSHVWVVDGLDPCGKVKPTHNGELTNYDALASYLNRRLGDLARSNRNAGFDIVPGRVDAVVHSMGGLLTRYYAHRKPGVIDRLIMLGTPNAGIDVVDVTRGWCNSVLDFDPKLCAVRLTGNAIAGSLCRNDLSLSCPATDQLGRSFTAGLTRETGTYPACLTQSVGPGPRVHAIAGISADYFKHTLGGLLAGDLFSATDGVVELNSVFAVGGCHYAVDNVWHNDLTTDQTTFDSYVGPILDGVQPATWDGPQPGPARTETIAGHWDVLYSQGYRLPSGTGAIASFPAPAADSIGVWLVSFGGPLVSAVVTSPMGVVASSPLANGDSIYVLPYRVGNAVAGAWQVQFTAAAGSDSMDVFVVARSLNGASYSDSLWVTGSGPLRDLHVRTGLSLAGAPAVSGQVQASLRFTNGSAVTVPLFDDGLHGDGGAADGVFATTRSGAPQGEVVTATYQMAPFGSLASGLQLYDLRELPIGDLDFPTVALMSPRAGTLWQSATLASVTWRGSDAGGMAGFELRLSANGGATFPYLIGAAGPADTTVVWTVADLRSDSCRVLIRATDLAGNVATDTTIGMFRVANYSPVGIGGNPVLRFAMGQAVPNPTSGRVSIPLSLSRDGRAWIAVFDLQGRIVRVLSDGLSEAGEHLVTWDGRTSGDSRAGPAVYFIRVRTLEGTLQRRVVLTR